MATNKKRAKAPKVNEARSQIQAAATKSASPPGNRLKLALVFAAILAAHFAWNTYVEPSHCEVPATVETQDPTGTEAEVDSAETLEGDQCTPLEAYFEAGNQWLGLSYALGLTFAFYAFSRFRADRSRKAENATLGGLGLAGFIYAVSCFLIGCCGSPMLSVWLGVLGPHFLPISRPLVLLITLVSVVWGWRILNRKNSNQVCDCDCDPLDNC